MARSITGRSIIVSICIAAAADAQAPLSVPVRGRVVDSRTLMPVALITVLATAGRDTVGRARSDSDGAFTALVSVPSGTVVVHFSGIGHRPDSTRVTLPLASPLRVAMEPITAAIALRAVVVRDTARSAFERRARRGGGGTFIRAEDIEKRNPTQTSDLFRSIPGVTIGDSSGITRITSLRGIRQAPPGPRRVLIGSDSISIPTSNARRCAMRVGVNGRLMPADFSLDDMRPEEIAGIEVYLGPSTIPAEFSSVRRDAPCGLIMVWTKS